VTESNLAPHPARHWAAVVLLLGALLALIVWRERPPRAKPASIAASEFSAERAWKVLSCLADSIGYRVSGTPGARRAEEYLVARLREAPGVEVEVQEVSGARPTARGATGYTLRNVLARIPGRSRDAVLLSAHYDTPPGSVGAGDDGVAASALVELVHALAAGPRPEHTIIAIINDGEEQGLLGAHGFVQHPWFRDVRAFVNLESAGPHGKAILFQAGLGGEWLVSAYARSVPYPYGTVLGQDIFQSGAIPSDTDFRIYRDFGRLVGLDIALYRGGWAYHTQRDRTWNVSPGSVQQMGENALALARELASRPLEVRGDGGRAIYYDVLGLFMLSYGGGIAAALAAVASLLAVVAVLAVVHRGLTTARATARALLSVAASVVLATVAAVAIGAAAAYVAGRPMSWYSHPWWGVSAFALAALGGALAAQWALVRRRPGARRDHGAIALHCALLLFWTIVLVLLSIARIGSAYIALWWVAGLAPALLVVAFVRSWSWRSCFTIGVLPAGVLTLQLLVLLAMLFVPVFGRLPLPIPPDLVLGAMLAVPAGAIALALLPGARLADREGRAALVVLAAALVLMGVSVLQPRYTERRAQRLEIVHYQSADTSSLRVYGMDYITPRAALAGDDAMRPARNVARPLEFAAAAAPTDLAPPEIQVVEESPDGAGDVRTLTLRVRAARAFRLRLQIPRERIAGWSVPTELPAASTRGVRLDWVAPPDSGVVLTLRVRGAAPLSLDAAAIRYESTTAAAALARSLPPWTDHHALAVNATAWTER